jgi:hypothetical protein
MSSSGKIERVNVKVVEVKWRREGGKGKAQTKGIKSKKSIHQSNRLSYKNYGFLAASLGASVLTGAVSAFFSSFLSPPSEGLPVDRISLIFSNG